MAATRLRRTFQYPTESDDEDAVEQGMDEQGIHILPVLTSQMPRFTLPPHPTVLAQSIIYHNTPTRPRTPHLHALSTRHLLDTHLHRAPLRASHRPRNTPPPAAHEHLDVALQLMRNNEFRRKRIHAIFLTAAAC
jgi:hypothetical protein